MPSMVEGRREFFLGKNRSIMMLVESFFPSTCMCLVNCTEHVLQIFNGLGI